MLQNRCEDNSEVKVRTNSSQGIRARQHEQRQKKKTVKEIQLGWNVGNWEEQAPPKIKRQPGVGQRMIYFMKQRN